MSLIDHIEQMELHIVHLIIVMNHLYPSKSDLEQKVINVLVTDAITEYSKEIEDEDIRNKFITNMFHLWSKE